MKNAFITRVLTVVLILGLMSANITPNNVNAKTNSDPLLETPPPVIQSLSGSNITFYPAGGGAGGYVPGVPTTLYFRSDVFTDDYEYLENTWLKFPLDWAISGVTVVGTPTCTSGTGAWGNFALLDENPPYEINIQHSAIMATSDHCTAIYAIQLTPGAAAGTVSVSWYYAGDTGPDGAKKPNYVCSSDRYTPDSMALYDCEEWVKPLATIPIAVPPVAQDQSVSTLEDTPKAFNLVATDPNSLPLTYSIVTQPAHGSVGVVGNVATYAPYANYNGTDSFNFKANNGVVDSNVATVSLTITAVPDAPVAFAQSVFTVEDNARIINLVATDADGDTLTYSIVDQPVHGSVGLSGKVATYTPAANYIGPDSFTFMATDSALDSNVATVSITVNPVNDPPVAQDQSVTTDEDTPKVITLAATDADGDALTYSIVTQSGHGAVVLVGNVATYTPAANYFGPDSFTFKAKDAIRDSNIATVSITITAVNDQPVEQSQAVTTAEDTALGITLTATDVEGDTLTYFVLVGPTHGTLTGAAPNLIYTPAADYFGPDSFTFIANDVTANSGTATVSINVTAVNDAPLAQDQSVSVILNTFVDINLIATDVDGDTLTYSIATQPAHGAISLVANVARYTPTLGYLGPDSFTFTANDGTIDSNVATVTINVKTDNIPPTAEDQTVITPEDTEIAITLLATDVDLDSLTYSIVTSPAHGTVDVVQDVATYTPAPNYFGTDSFTFTASDGIEASNVAIVSITVTSKNDAPTNLSLTNDIVAENTSIGTVVGTFSTIDLDTGETFKYEFATGGADNAAFDITGDQLLTNALFDHETKSSYSIWISTTDQGGLGLTFQKDFIITITDVNESPSDLFLSSNSLEESLPIDTVVGTLSTMDQDAGETFSYAIADGGVDNAAFKISGDQLLTKASFDFETKTSYSIKIRTTDLGNLFFEKDFIITIIDVNEAPIVSDIPDQTIVEGENFLTINLDTFVTDPDNLASEMIWSYTGSVELTVSIQNQVATITTPNVDWNGSETITFRATDPGSLWDEDIAAFTVTPVNDAPVAQEQSVTTAKDVPVAITIVATDVDGDTLNYLMVAPPNHGTLSGTIPNLTYTPDAGYFGTDSFTFMAQDYGLLSNLAMVSITVSQTTTYIFLPIILR